MQSFNFLCVTIKLVKSGRGQIFNYPASEGHSNEVAFRSNVAQSRAMEIMEDLETVESSFKNSNIGINFILLKASYDVLNCI